MDIRAARIAGRPFFFWRAPVSTLPPITVSSLDLARLEALLDSPAGRAAAGADALAAELLRANVVGPGEVPADVVAMESTVDCEDELSGEAHVLTLVYPRDADPAQGKVSVLAPVGSALLGLSVGQSIDWRTPNGRSLRLKVTGLRPAAA